MLRDPRVSVTVIDSADPEHYVELRGRVSMTPDVGRALDTQLSWKYDGQDPGEDPVDQLAACHVIRRCQCRAGEEAAGYLVRTAKDGAQGWSDLQSEACDLVVADVEMPMMDGFELVGRIRADERHRHLPVVLVTSRDSLQDRERGIQAGADAYIVKGGFDQDHLLETIRRLI